jgi:hypothetical protein
VQCDACSAWEGLLLTANLQVATLDQDVARLRIDKQQQ